VYEESSDDSRSGHRFELVVQNALDGVWVSDLAGRFLDVNDAACRTLGYTRDELLSMSAADIEAAIPPDEMPLALQRLADAGTAVFETQHRCKNGSIVEMELSCTLDPVTRDRFYVFGRNLTLHRRQEAQLRRTLLELQRSNRDLEQFAYVASHDLQEPLRKIQAFSDLLAGTCGDELGHEARDYLSRLQSAAARMGALVDDLLLLSRAAAESRPFVEVDLNDLLAEVIQDLEPRIAEQDATVRVATLPAIVADPAQMRRLFLNLVGNALKFKKPWCNVEVDVAARVFDASVEISVADNGIGFDSDHERLIFEPFQRLHSRAEYGGTGVGLAIVRRIVERHGGVVSARGRPGAGATFLVELPRSQP